MTALDFWFLRLKNIVSYIEWLFWWNSLSILVPLHTEKYFATWRTHTVKVLEPSTAFQQSCLEDSVGRCLVGRSQVSLIPLFLSNPSANLIQNPIISLSLPCYHSGLSHHHRLSRFFKEAHIWCGHLSPLSLSSTASGILLMCKFDSPPKSYQNSPISLRVKAN